MEIDTIEFIGGSCIFLLLVIVIGCVVFGVVDEIYKSPQAADIANEICKEMGYDSYEKFSRVGFLSTEPVAIRCKYVDNYKDIDMRISRDD